MALTYTTKAAELASSHNARVAQQISQITKLAADRQRAKNKQAEGIVKEGQQFATDFFGEYEKQTKSGISAWNNGASELVGRLATEQEELYSKAFGSGGTPQLRNDFRIKQAKDKKVIADIGSWAVLSNTAGEAVISNQQANDQDVDLGRVTRGSSNEKYNFSQNMQNDQYSNFKFNIDDSGNVILNATNVDKNGDITRNDSENLSADVANQAQGNDWFTTIGEEDLLQKQLGERWTNKENGYGTLFEPTEKNRKTYNPVSKKWIETQEKVYDPDQVKDDLLNKYSSRLNTEIKGPGFEKTWDQLWRGGFLVDNEGEAIDAGDISWREAKQISSMNMENFKEKYGDANKDGVVNEIDKSFLSSKIDETARIGLANYYSEIMSPQENQLVKTSVIDEKPSGTGSLSEANKVILNKDRPQFEKLLNNSSNIADMPIYTDPNDPNTFSEELHQAKASAMVKDLNNNKVTGGGGDFPVGRVYMTGAEYVSYVEKSFNDVDIESNIDDNAIYMVNKIKNPKVGATESGQQYQNYIPKASELITSDNTSSMNSKDISIYLSDAAGITPKSRNYLISTSSSSIKVFNTREEAEKAAGANGKVFAGAGKNKGKFTIK